ncbi:MAG: aminotransferase class III-fold pyridoxal phosphate-dependent enzyme [Acidobacteriota bacterium]
MSDAHADMRRLQKALAAIRRMRDRIVELETAAAPPIAVVGTACRVPGADDPDALWRLVAEGTVAIRDAPVGRWATSAPHRGGFLDDIAGFDAAFFGIAPREARRMDPQQRLLLEVVWEAIERAAIDPRALDGSATGVYVGIAEAEYLQALQTQRRADQGTGRDDADTPPIYDLTGTSASVAAGRISYQLGLRGPCLALDTACSASLVAVHLAVRALRAGECDLALAGGVNLLVSVDASAAFASAGALAADGRCKSFDAAADGYGRGEGCGVVVLKRLADARDAGDPILALIRGSATTQDGRTNGLTAPNGGAQQDVIRRALKDADLPPSEIAFVETHGTGTALGDPIELEALGAVFGRRKTPLALGAVKANLGHLEAAAGVVGLIQTIEVLRRRTIPPLAGLSTPTPQVDWQSLPLSLPTAPTPWPEGARAAGISSFGFSGTNAHVVLEAAPASAGPDDPDPTGSPLVLPLSARTPSALAALASRWATELREATLDPTDEAAARLADLCLSAGAGRAAFEQRAAIVADDLAGCADGLEALAAGTRMPRLKVGRAAARPRLAFLFTGQGAQQVGMGRELFERHAGFRRRIEQCDETLRAQMPEAPSLVSILYPPDGPPDSEGQDTPAPIHRTLFAQPALFALEVALAELWRGWGAEPAVVLGHSTGELAAACVAGAFDVDTGLRLIVERARRIEAATGGGATAAALADAETVAPRLAAHDGVDLAGLNGPRETLIAGAADAVDAAVEDLTAAGISCRRLQIPHAPHSPLIDPVLDDFEQSIADLRFEAPRLELISNVTGDTAESLDAAYWRRQMRGPVRFTEGVAALAARGCNIFLEIGPQPVLQLLARQSWPGGDAAWVSSLWSPRGAWRQLQQAAAELWTAGIDLDWRAVIDEAVVEDSVADNSTSRPRRVALPTYPFERQRLWVDDASSPPEAKLPEIRSAETTTEPTGEGLRDAITSQIVGWLAERLELPAEAIDAERSLLSLGADSLLAGRIVQDLADHHGVVVGLGRVFDDLDTPQALAAHVARNRPQDHSAVPEVSPTTSPAASDPAGSDGSLQALFAAQLDVIHRQLDLLGTDADGGTGVRETVSRLRALTGARDPSPPTRRAAPAPPAPEPRPLDARQRRFVDALIARAVARTPASRRRALPALRRRVDTRTRAVRPELRELAYPLVAARAAGAHFTDVDGHEYVDLAMGIGAHLCGHAPLFVADAIAAQTRRGLQTGPVADLADEVAARVAALTGTERVLFGVTGTGAVRAALRVAQAATGRRRFVQFAGSYHGQDDRVLAVANPDQPLSARPMVAGVSSSATSDALVLPYDERALATIEEQADTLAAVLVEPVQSRNPRHQPVELLHRLRELTERVGVPLLFDEVITGFRVDAGGAQARFDVRADLAVYGKCIGGGLPLSLVAGRADLLDQVDGGGWLAAGVMPPPTTFVGSTFEMHPYALTATRAMLDHLEAAGPELQHDLERATGTLGERLDEVFARAGLPLSVHRFASIFRFAWKDNVSYVYQPLEIELFHHLLLERGVYLWEGRTCFLSTAHDEAALDTVVAAAEDAADALIDGGFGPSGDETRGGTRGGLPRRALDLPVGAEQRACLALHQDLPGDARRGPDWVVSEEVELRGALDVGALQTAVDRLVARHDALRTVFPIDPVGDDSPPTQRVPASSQVPSVPVERVELRARDDADWRARRGAWWRQDLERPFDLARGPLLRVALLERADDHHHLALRVHHAVCDGLSMIVLLEELAALYGAFVSGDEAELAAGHQPSALARWHADATRSAALDAAVEAWHRRLPDGPPRLTWPEHFAPDGAERRRPETAGRRHTARVDAELLARLQELGRDHRCTLFMTLLAAFTHLLQRHAGRDEMLVGVPVAGRPFAEAATLVGYCSHLVPVLSRRPQETTVDAHLDATRRAVVDAFEHQDVPFARLAAALGWCADEHAAGLDTPLAAIFNLDQAIDCPRFGALHGRFHPVPARFAQVDLRLDAIEHDGGLHLDLDVRRRSVSPAAATAWCDDFLRTLRQMVDGHLEPLAVSPRPIVHPASASPRS